MTLIKFPSTAGQIIPQVISVDTLIELGNSPKYEYEGQRDHGKNGKKRKHTNGLLRGDSQVFAAVRVLEVKRTLFIDGYHRSMAVRDGNAEFAPGATLVLNVHCVATMAEADALYEQFNSMAAAKKSGCHFESGLRKCKVLKEVVSRQFTKGPKATAVQLAAGTKKTTQAVVDTIDGILFVNKLALDHEKHEMGGVLGAFVAIAQHCKNKRLATSFIRNVNGAYFDPIDATDAELVVKIYHGGLVARNKGSKTGSANNDAVFSMGLAAFARFAYLSKGWRGAPKEQHVTLARFMVIMESFNKSKR